jgi:hypothetical protein
MSDVHHHRFQRYPVRRESFVTNLRNRNRKTSLDVRRARRAASAAEPAVTLAQTTTPVISAVAAPDQGLMFNNMPVRHLVTGINIAAEYSPSSQTLTVGVVPGKQQYLLDQLVKLEARLVILEEDRSWEDDEDHATWSEYDDEKKESSPLTNLLGVKRVPDHCVTPNEDVAKADPVATAEHVTETDPGTGLESVVECAHVAIVETEHVAMADAGIGVEPAVECEQMAVIETDPESGVDVAVESAELVSETESVAESDPVAEVEPVSEVNSVVDEAELVEEVEEVEETEPVSDSSDGEVSSDSEDEQKNLDPLSLKSQIKEVEKGTGSARRTTRSTRSSHS